MPNVPVVQSEKDFQGAVSDYGMLKGWTIFLTYRSTHSPAGEPDLRMVKPPRVIFAELKREDGKTTAKQKEALDLLGQCPGVETYLWRPSDWPTIERILE